MKIVMALTALLCAASPALAISSYDSPKMACGEVQQKIQSEGAVLLRYPARDGRATLYDRYVSDSLKCPVTNYAAPSSVPTSDNAHCPVRNCQSASDRQPR
jgi:hypothetical protein